MLTKYFGIWWCIPCSIKVWICIMIFLCIWILASIFNSIDIPLCHTSTHFFLPKLFKTCTRSLSKSIREKICMTFLSFSRIPSSTSKIICTIYSFNSILNLNTYSENHIGNISKNCFYCSNKGEST